jgi:hypothetical protein
VQNLAAIPWMVPVKAAKTLTFARFAVTTAALPSRIFGIVWMAVTAVRSLGALLVRMSQVVLALRFSKTYSANAASFAILNRIGLIVGMSFRTMRLLPVVVLGASGSISAHQAPLASSIAHVVLLCSQIEMIGVHAAWIVPSRTIVTDKHAFGDRATKKLPSHAMRPTAMTPCLVLPIKATMTIREQDSGPQPATVRTVFINSVPERLQSKTFAVAEVTPVRTETAMPVFVRHKKLLMTVVATEVDSVKVRMHAKIPLVCQGSQRDNVGLPTSVCSRHCTKSETLGKQEASSKQG